MPILVGSSCCLAYVLVANCEAFSVVELLLEEGADVEACTRKGITPLHIASKEGFAEIILQLRDAGAEVNPQVSFLKASHAYKCQTRGSDIVHLQLNYQTLFT